MLTCCLMPTKNKFYLCMQTYINVVIFNKLDPSISMQLQIHMWKIKHVHLYSYIFTFTCIVYDIEMPTYSRMPTGNKIVNICLYNFGSCKHMFMKINKKYMEYIFLMRWTPYVLDIFKFLFQLFALPVTLSTTQLFIMFLNRQLYKMPPGLKGQCCEKRDKHSSINAC